jgi:hypothetical protein
LTFKIQFLSLSPCGRDLERGSILIQRERGRGKREQEKLMFKNMRLK